MCRPVMKMSLLTLSVILSILTHICTSKEIRQQQKSANIPFYSLIFSEKFPPTISGRSSLDSQDIRTNEISVEKEKPPFLPRVFIPAKNKGNAKIEKEEDSTFQRVMRIARNLKMALYDFADVTLIRSVVDLGFDGFSPQERIKGRSDTPPEKGNTALRNMLTYVLAGLMGKEDCKHRLLCELGNLIKPVRGKAVLFIMFDTVIPRSWTEFRTSVKVFENGTLGKSSCSIYKCDHEKHTVVERL